MVTLDSRWLWRQDLVRGLAQRMGPEQRPRSRKKARLTKLLLPVRSRGQGLPHMPPCWNLPV